MQIAAANIENINGVFTSLLKEFSGRRVKFFVNGGNAGDSLIAAASFQLLRRYNIAFDPIWYGAPVDNEILFLGGGGNLVPEYDSMKKAVVEYASRAKVTVMFPHTIRGNEDVLGALDDRCYIFCREAVSYAHTLRNCGSRNVFLGHDVAFHLDAGAIKGHPKAADWLLKYSTVLQEKHVDLNLEPYYSNAHFTRTDSESSKRLARFDCDISQLFSFGVWPNEAEKSAYCLLRAIETPKSLSTDRLHVGIGAHLLGRPAVLFDNSYGKNRDVYQHTLAKLPTSVSLFRDRAVAA